MFWYEFFFKNRINPFQQSDAFHIKTSNLFYCHLFCRAGFYMKRNTGLAWVNLIEAILKFCKFFAMVKSFKAAMDFQFPRLFL